MRCLLSTCAYLCVSVQVLSMNTAIAPLMEMRAVYYRFVLCCAACCASLFCVFLGVHFSVSAAFASVLASLCVPFREQASRAYPSWAYSLSLGALRAHSTPSLSSVHMIKKMFFVHSQPRLLLCVHGVMCLSTLSFLCLYLRVFVSARVCARRVQLWWSSCTRLSPCSRSSSFTTSWYDLVRARAFLG